MAYTNFFPINVGGANADWINEDVPMIGNVVIAEGSAIYRVGDGTHTKSTNATGNFKGILAEAIASTDSDLLTSKKRKSVYVPKTINAKAEFTVGAGTFTTDDIGKSVKFHDEKSLAVDTAGTQAVIIEYISPTRGICIFNPVIS